VSKKRTIVIVAAAVAVLLLIGFSWRRATRHACCICELEQIAGAKQAWAIQYNKTTNDIPTLADLQPIIFPGRKDEPLVFRCPKGGTYTVGRVGEAPRCSIGGSSHTLPQ